MKVLSIRAAGVVVAATLTAAACGGGGETARHVAARSVPRATVTASPPDGASSGRDRFVATPDTGLPVPFPPQLDPAPVGVATEIALRFVRALQRQDDEAAVAQLSVIGRSYFAAHRDAASRVMQDVAAHAQLRAAGTCTRADRLSPDAVVVRCGRRNIVVHVLDDPLAPGVELAPWHVRHDVFHGPHAHAFTTVLL